MRISLLIITLLINGILFAQKDTYFQAHFGYSSTGLKIPFNTPKIYTQWYSGGCIYEFSLRKEISPILSIGTGYSNRSYSQSFGLSNNKFYSFAGFETHQIPLKVNLDIDLFKDVISLYASYGYMFNIEYSSPYNDNISSTYTEESFEIEFILIPESKYRSTFLMSTGARLRVFEELRFEIEGGRAFGLKDLRIYNFTYLDNSNSLETLTIKDKCNYWYFKFGFSYPMRRVGEIARKGISKLL